MRYFKSTEFSCQCGRCSQGYEQMSNDLLARLDFARHIADVPFSINSAIRCPDHNSTVGGLDNSSHLRGLAVDIKTQDGRARFRDF